jgi:hypothetical protein
MRVIDRWRDDGFAVVASEYLFHLAPESGAQRDIGEDGELLVHDFRLLDFRRKAERGQRLPLKIDGSCLSNTPRLETTMRKIALIVTSLTSSIRENARHSREFGRAFIDIETEALAPA